MTAPVKQPNNDENIANFIGNFHKTLPHNAYGEVNVDAYLEFKEICDRADAGEVVDFELVASGEAACIMRGAQETAQFTSPLAGAATEIGSPDPQDFDMPPAPGILSDSAAAEMVELYWMAALRDVPLAEFLPENMNPRVLDAVEDIQLAYNAALTNDTTEGAIRLGLDLPMQNGVLDIRPQTLFRSGLPGEEYGPLVSQFFLRDIPYGVQTISTKQVPYIRGQDFLTHYQDWLCAQNTGKDRFGRDYGHCNYYEDQQNGLAVYYPVGVKRHVSTMRDFARFVNRDALHQAYFNAALFLLEANAPVDQGNPYGNGTYTREGAFATLGGPDLLTLVSEVSSRALKIVWRQKWLVHRRCRPEVYGGLLHMQLKGEDGLPTKDYGLSDVVVNSAAVQNLYAKNHAYFLPIAFSAGSPNHPAYGAGHATVAGACVTILKAWFKDDEPLQNVLKDMPFGKEPGHIQGLLQPGFHRGGEEFAYPSTYTGNDAADMTVGGELNKLASNVGMGRSMGGVHWRSDNTRSLRLGEDFAIRTLYQRVREYAEQPVSFSFRSFDNKLIHITPEGVTADGIQLMV